MALIDLKFATKAVEAGDDQSFTVRGLCFDDLAFLMTSDPTGMNELVQRIQEGELPDEIAASHVGQIILNMPKLPALIIACASDDSSPEAVAIARRLPVTVVITALLDIIKLSFEPYGGVKKFAAATRDALAEQGIQYAILDKFLSTGSIDSGSPQAT